MEVDRPNLRDLRMSGYIVRRTGAADFGVARFPGCPPCVIVPHWATVDYEETELGGIITAEIRRKHGGSSVVRLLTDKPGRKARPQPAQLDLPLPTGEPPREPIPGAFRAIADDWPDE